MASSHLHCHPRRPNPECILLAPVSYAAALDSIYQLLTTLMSEAFVYTHRRFLSSELSIPATAGLSLPCSRI